MGGERGLLDVESGRCVMIGGQVGMQFQIGGRCGQGGIWKFVYDTDRPAFMERDLMGLCVDGNW